MFLQQLAKVTADCQIASCSKMRWKNIVQGVKVKMEKMVNLLH
jgi:hypothetical protein